MRVLIADEHDITRLGLRAVLEKAEDIVVVADVFSVEEALIVMEKQIYQGQPVDVLLMGFHFFPKKKKESLSAIEIDAIQYMRRLSFPPKILLISSHDSSVDTLQTLGLGLSGCLSKDSAAKELIEAVRSVVEGKAVPSPVLAEQLRRNKYKEESFFPTLTNREIEVLHLVSHGYSNKKIGEELILSEATVKSHLVHIYDKLGVRSRTAATAVAREWGIIF